MSKLIFENSSYKTNISWNVSARSECRPFSEQQPSAWRRTHRHQVRCEREIKRDRTRRAGLFRGRTDERIVNSIYHAPQIRLTSSLAIKMIDPLDQASAPPRPSRRWIVASAFHPLLLAFHVYRSLKNILPSLSRGASGVNLATSILSSNER